MAKFGGNWGAVSWGREAAVSEKTSVVVAERCCPNVLASRLLQGAGRERIDVHLFLNKHEQRLTLGPPRNNQKMIKDRGVWARGMKNENLQFFRCGYRPEAFYY